MNHRRELLQSGVANFSAGTRIPSQLCLIIFRATHESQKLVAPVSELVIHCGPNQPAGACEKDFQFLVSDFWVESFTN